VQNRLDRFACDHYNRLRSEIAANCAAYDAGLPPWPAPL